MEQDIMISFRLAGLLKEPCLMRLSQILCLLPASYSIRTVEHGWTCQVLKEDWPIVEKSFRQLYDTRYSEWQLQMEEKEQ